MPVAAITSSIEVAKGMYGTYKAHHRRQAMLTAASDATRDAGDRELAAYMADQQRKRRNRATLNTVSSALSAAGAAAALTGVGIIPGLALGAAGAALKLGAWGLRKFSAWNADRRARNAGQVTPSQRKADERGRMADRIVEAANGRSPGGLRLLQSLGLNAAEIDKLKNRDAAIAFLAKR